MSEQAEAMGDRIGSNDPAAANIAYRLSGVLRKDADEMAAAYMEQNGTSH